jgi:hypothetical protein
MGKIGDERTIVEAYSKLMLSDTQVAQRIGTTVGRVRWVLRKNHVPKRSISEAITRLHITKFGKKPFALKKKLNRKERLLKVAAIMLYWGEGNKKGSTVALSNSDPLMVEVFLKFLRLICGVDQTRVRVGLHYYQDQNMDTLLSFWSRVTRLPIQQFDRPFMHVRKSGSYKTRSIYGTVAIRYSDKKLLETIIKWIKEYQVFLCT